jgi:hypothetical protein
MLSITKNKSKNSHASVTFVRPPTRQSPQTRPSQPQSVPQQPQLPSPRPQRQPAGGIQRNLTESTFRQYLDGFVGILPKDLPTTIGNRLRYAIDTVDASGNVVSTQYRLGGWVRSVSPDLSRVALFNPYVKKSWTLTVPQPPNKRLRLYFARRGTSDETAMIRALISQVQDGRLRIASYR